MQKEATNFTLFAGSRSWRLVLENVGAGLVPCTGEERETKDPTLAWCADRSHLESHTWAWVPCRWRSYVPGKHECLKIESEDQCMNLGPWWAGRSSGQHTFEAEDWVQGWLGWGNHVPPNSLPRQRRQWGDVCKGGMQREYVVGEEWLLDVFTDKATIHARREGAETEEFGGRKLQDLFTAQTDAPI